MELARYNRPFRGNVAVHPPIAFNTREGNIRAALNRILSDGSTVANYQPGNFTGTLNASAWLNSIGIAGSLDQATAGNQPIILPFSGEKYGYWPKVAGNDFRTVDAPANRITGDIDIRQKIALNAYGSSYETTASKWLAAGDQRAWFVNIDLTTKKINFGHTTDGITNVNKTSTVGLSTADAESVWIRVAVDVDDGAGNYVVYYYTSTDYDPGTLIGTWTALGTPVTTASTTSIFNSTADVIIGEDAGSTLGEPGGKVYRTQILNGIDGTLAVDFNAADWPETSTNGATQVSSTTGETWTLNNTGAKLAQIVASPSLLFDGTASFLKAAAFTLPQPAVAIMVVKQISHTTNDYFLDGNATNSFSIFQSSISATEVGIYAGTTSVYQPQAAMNVYSIIIGTLNGASSAIQYNSNAATTGNAGAAIPGGLTLGANGGGIAGFISAQYKESIVLNAIPSAEKLAQIISLLNAIHGVY